MNKKTKLPAGKLEEMSRRANAGESATSLAKEYGTHVSTVYFWKNKTKGNTPVIKRTPKHKFVDVPLVQVHSKEEDNVAVVITSLANVRHVLESLKWK